MYDTLLELIKARINQAIDENWCDSVGRKFTEYDIVAISSYHDSILLTLLDGSTYTTYIDWLNLPELNTLLYLIEAGIEVSGQYEF